MKPTLTDITGIGPSTAKDLADGGIRTVDDLANASASAICAVPGFGAIRAARIKAAAAELIRRSGSSAVATEESTEPELEPESVMTTEQLKASEADEPEKPGKEANKKTKKEKKAKKEKGKSKKDKKDKKGDAGGKKGKKQSGK